MTQYSVVQLRNARLAVVERHKLLKYLLNASHPDNGGKAKSRRRMVRTVWIIDRGSDTPRLVTVYPGRE
jgi:hypothetical protein